MKKRGVFLIFIAAVLFLSGCQISTPTNTSLEASPVQVLSGVVKTQGSSFVLMSGAKTTEIFSRKLDLSAYEGKQVTVTGEFSGTTLFVDEIK